MKKIGMVFKVHQYNVFKADHLFDSRDNKKYTRDNFITDEMYLKILKVSLQEGLTSFRGSTVVIRFNDSRGGSWGLLVALEEDRSIHIITAYRRSATKWYRSFHKNKNEINLWQKYTLPSLSEKDKLDKKSELHMRNANQFCYEDDNVFNKYAQRNGIKKLK